MDREKARIILSAYRPGRDDATDPAVVEALALLEHDAELSDWLANEHAMDRLMAAAVQSIEPPAQLKASILAAATAAPVPSPRPSWQRPAWIGIAATIALLAGIAFVLSPRPRAGVPMAVVDAAIPRLTQLHQHSFGTGDGDMGKIRTWFARHGGTADFDVPHGLQGTRGIGCEVAAVQGAKVSIICFDLPNGRPAHLYVMDRSQLQNPPPPNHPEFQQHGAIAMASWSDGRRSYILAMPGDESAVRALL